MIDEQRLAGDCGWCRHRAAGRRRARCRPADRPCRSPRSSACGSRGSCWRGRPTWPGWPPRPGRGPVPARPRGASTVGDVRARAQTVSPPGARLVDEPDPDAVPQPDHPRFGLGAENQRASISWRHGLRRLAVEVDDALGQRRLDDLLRNARPGGCIRARRRAADRRCWRSPSGCRRRTPRTRRSIAWSEFHSRRLAMIDLDIGAVEIGAHLHVLALAPPRPPRGFRRGLPTA